jgi:hypothetical protein
MAPLKNLSIRSPRKLEVCLSTKYLFGMNISKCPNRECIYRRGSGEKFFVKRGYFVTQWNAQPVPRYRCKACGRYFSTHTFLKTWRQKKPYLNKAVYFWYVSAVTQRRMAKVLNVSRSTIVRKFLFLARYARFEHERWLREGRLQTEKAQFDEMESFVHSRLKPLSLPMVVNETTGTIVDIRVASMPAHGKLAKVSRLKYGYRPDQRNEARQKVLKTLARVSSKNLKLTSDKNPSYPTLVKRILPLANFLRVKRRKFKKRSHFIANRRNRNDALHSINHVGAKIRHDLSRMGRKVWVTTKKASRLQAHLNLYLAFNNGYAFTEAFSF